MAKRKTKAKKVKARHSRRKAPARKMRKVRRRVPARTRKGARKAPVRKIRMRRASPRKVPVRRVRKLRMLRKAAKKRIVKKAAVQRPRKVVKSLKVKAVFRSASIAPPVPQHAHEVEVGKVTHYYTHLGVAVVEITNALRVGDLIHIKGHSTDLKQRVESMQIERQAISEAKKGQCIGLKVVGHVREHDAVHKVV